MQGGEVDIPYIPLADCEKGHLYKVRCRNFVLGIFDGETGFIGIRAKFGNRFLDTEFHWDQGPPYGTVLPLEDLGPVPGDIEIYEHRLGEFEGRQCYLENEPLRAFLEKQKVEE